MERFIALWDTHYGFERRSGQVEVGVRCAQYAGKRAAPHEDTKARPSPIAHRRSLDPVPHSFGFSNCLSSSANSLMSRKWR